MGGKELLNQRREYKKEIKNSPENSFWERGGKSFLKKMIRFEIFQITKSFQEDI